MPKHYEEIKVLVDKIVKEEKIKSYDAFILFALRDLMGLEESIYSEALEAGGPKDCGIDAFWSDDESIYVLQSKFYKPSLKVKEEEIDTFSNALLYLDGADPEQLKSRCKRYIKEKAIEYKELKSEGKDTRLIFITSSHLTPAAKNKWELLTKQSKDIKFEVWDIDEVYNQFTANRRQERPDVIFQLVGKEYYSSKGAVGANAPYAVVTIRATDLFETYYKYKGSIFTQNLRYYLGKSGKINKEIRKTIESPGNRDRFWYFNNGLTIVCDEFNIQDDKIKIKNLQIVNGGQTTRGIYDALLDLGKGVGEKIFLVARVIQASDNEKLIRDIRDYNNRQNPTKPRDFVAHFELQKELQKSFLGLNIFYEIGRGERDEHFQAKEIKKKKLTVVDNLTVSQAQYSFMGFPAEAKSQKASLLDPIQQHYSKIFTSDRNARELLFSYLSYKKAKDEYFKIRHSKTEIQEDLEYLVHGTTHLVAIMGEISRKIVKIDQYFQDLEGFEKIRSDKFIDALYVLANEYLQEIYGDKLHDYRQEKKSLVPSKYFKNAAEAERILEKVDYKINRDKKRLSINFKELIA